MVTLRQLQVVLMGTGVVLLAGTVATAQRPAPAQPQPDNQPRVRGQAAPEAQPGARQPANPAATPNTRQNANPNAVANPRGAARPAAAANAPTVTGQVVAYEADKTITIETKRRGGETQKTEFTIEANKSKIELLGETKAIAVGVTVSVFADKDNPKFAQRIVAGTPTATGRGRATPAAQPATPRQANPGAQPATPRQPNPAPANPNPARRPAN